MLADKKISYWAADVHGQPLQYMTIGELLDSTARKYPDCEALVYSIYPELGIDVRWTYTEFRDMCHRVAKGLIALGVTKGDRVAIWATNIAEWLLMEFATAKIGAILVTVNTNYKPKELEYLLNQSGSSFLFMIEKYRDNDYLQTIYSLAPELERCQPGRLSSERLPHLQTLVNMRGEKRAGFFCFDDLYEMAQAVSDETFEKMQKAVQPYDIAQVQYTSGTTGFPKGAMLKHHSILNNAYFWTDCLGLNEKTRWCNPMPLFHTGGCVLGALGSVSQGACHVPIIEFDPLKVLQALHKERCTFLGSVPTMLISYMEHPQFPEFDLSNLKLIISGGAPVPVELSRRVKEKMGAEIRVVYGLTEAGPVITQTLLRDPPEFVIDTVGRPLAYLEAKIIDPVTGETVPTGQTGELCCRGYNVMEGYYQMADRTAEAIDSEGWLHSGDLATMNDQGYFNIVGRSKDMIIRGGENIYPQEIEEFLITHPYVVDVHVVGVPDAKFGEQVAAVVKVKPGQTLTDEDVKDYCRRTISRHKIPKYIKFVEQFPLTASGKVQKFVLQRELTKELGLENIAKMKTA